MKIAPLLTLLVSLSTAQLACGQSGTIKVKSAYNKLNNTTINTVTDSEQGTSTETVLDQKQRVLEKTTFLLDEKGVAMAAVHYLPNGAIRYKESYQYDLQGRIVEKKFSDAVDQPLGRRVYIFAGNGTSAYQDYDARGLLIPPPKPASAARPDKKK